MARRGDWRRAAGLLVLTLALGYVAARSDHTAHAVGLWPVGLLTGVLLWSPARLRPPMAVAAALGSGTTLLSSGRPVADSAWLGIVMGVEAYAAVLVLGHGRAKDPALVSERDLLRYLSAITTAGVIGAAGSALLGLLGDTAQIGRLCLVALVAHAASQAVLIPLFVRLSTHDALSGRLEAALQWISLVGVTTVMFVPHQVPGLAFLVIPFLCWGALRRSMVETVWQLLVVFGIVGILTWTGHGPFTVVTRGALTPDTSVIALQAFALVCALIAMPLSMSVGAQRLLARDAFRERERLNQIVRSASGVAIMGTDERGRLNLFNPGAVQLTGYQPEEVLGRSPAMFHTPEEIVYQATRLGLDPDFEGLALHMTTSANPGRVDWQFLCKDGTIRNVSIRITTVTDDAGDVIGYVATGEDITDLVSTQEALLTALEAEREAVERLTHIDAAKDSFVSNVSHELRTPITNIVGYLELLQDGMYGEPTPPQHEALRRIEQNSERLLLLIEDLLTLSQIEEAGSRVSLASTDLRDLVGRVGEVVAPSVERRDLVFDVHTPELPVPAEVDQGKLERLLINLVNNAVKFTPDGGSVVLRLETRGDRIVMSVQDTGMGISEEDQERLFTRFFRSSTAEEHAIPGTGLGLSIAHNIATLHGGELTVTSTVGVGSTFRVSIPRRAEDGVATATVSA